MVSTFKEKMGFNLSAEPKGEAGGGPWRTVLRRILKPDSRLGEKVLISEA